MKVVLVAGGRDCPSQRRVFEVLNEENPHLVLHCCAPGSRRGPVAGPRSTPAWSCAAPRLGGGDGEAAATQRQRVLLALLSTFAVAGGEVLVVAVPDDAETAALVDAARSWPVAVREIAG
jgi:hypothetical protein